MTEVAESFRFHFRHALFNLREQFSDLPTALVANALIPFFIWLLSLMWKRFNASTSTLTFEQVVIYIGITELLFMTFVRGPSITRASQDFSISLARPRSWLMTSFSGIVGRSLGGRVLILPFLGANPADTVRAAGRLLLLFPILTVLQGLFALAFATAQVLWHQVDYFLLPFGKTFLVLGGVWGPVADFGEPWRQLLLKLPPSDLFFQPAHFCIKGHFYEMTESTWFMRVGLLALFLAIMNFYFFQIARKRHQALGG